MTRIDDKLLFIAEKRRADCLSNVPPHLIAAPGGREMSLATFMAPTTCESALVLRARASCVPRRVDFVFHDGKISLGPFLTRMPSEAVVDLFPFLPLEDVLETCEAHRGTCTWRRQSASNNVRNGCSSL